MGAWRILGTLVALLAGRHILAVLENQSHDLLVFLCAFLAVDALCAARAKTAGILAGLGAALKATPLLFAPLFLWQRRWAAFVCLLTALLVGSFLPDLVYPAKDGRMPGTLFRSGFPAWEAFTQFIDPGCSSTFWRRVMQ